MQGRKRTALFLASIAAIVAVSAAIIILNYHHNSDALWNIVSQRCLQGERQKADPAPCSMVNEPDGYVVLKDRHGPLQFLLLPVAKISGIESPRLLSPATPNFLSEAWRARHFMEERRGAAIGERVYSLAVNSRWGRTQNQLHVHISCLRGDVRQQLDALDPTLTERWQTHRLGKHDYAIRVISRDEFKRTSPFIRIANELPGAASKMADYGIAVAALQNGRRALMVTERNWLRFNLASAEELQDHSCALLK